MGTLSPSGTRHIIHFHEENCKWKIRVFCEPATDGARRFRQLSFWIAFNTSESAFFHVLIIMYGRWDAGFEVSFVE